MQQLNGPFEFRWRGKTYYIGYDHKSKNRDNWKLVVWKVE